MDVLHYEKLTKSIGIIRVFEEGKGWGDPYEAMLVIIERPDYMEIHGFCGHLSRPKLFRKRMGELFKGKPVKALRHGKKVVWIKDRQRREP
jgi:hypothetical protein